MDYCSKHIGQELVRVQGVEPWSQPWEGYIIAVIRHPLASMRQTYGFSHRNLRNKFAFGFAEPFLLFSRKYMEPPSRIELLTYALRMRRSTN